MDKGTVRPEQKSVALLRGIIRLFAPGTSDIVVDLFAGTMSAVVAALHEGRRVYACEMDPVCYGAGVGRVYRFQYRRGALGLVSSLERGHCDALGNSNVAAGVATDLVDGEGND
jgi:DNA modification methylase